MIPLSIGSLFSGIGGLELGLERAGLGPVLWQVEIDPLCRRVLAKHWPEARRYEDVRTVGASVLGPVDLVCGGFPCQDLSDAGKREGLAGKRSGLWFEYLRIIEEIHPRFVVIENVSGLRGRALDTVVTGLDREGYTVEATRISASDLGAPHRRSRILIVAYADRVDGSRVSGLGRPPVARTGEAVGYPYPDRQRQSQGDQREGGGWPGDAGQPVQRAWCAQPRLGGGADGIPERLDRRWPAGQGAYQHDWEPPRTIRSGSLRGRPALLRALGNAVVPACAETAGKKVLSLMQALEAA